MIIGLYDAKQNHWFTAPNWHTARKIIRLHGLPNKIYRCHQRDITRLFKRLGITDSIIHNWVTYSCYYSRLAVHMGAPEETFKTKFKCKHCGYTGTWTDSVSMRDGLGGTEEMRYSECCKCKQPEAYVEIQ
jgi:hypothetical protein